MLDKLLVGVQCHPSELIGREEEEELVQARKSPPLLTSRCKINTNGSPQEPLVEWTRTIDFLKHHNGPQTIFFHENNLSHLFNVT